MDILKASLEPLNQHLRFIFLDVFWRCIWLGLTTTFLSIFWFFIVAQLGSLQWEGPDLGPSNPIILIAALQQFWDSYGVTLLGEAGLLLLSVFLLWIVLEALFRGGFKGFWVYLGTSVGRFSVLGGAGAFFLLLGPRDPTGGTLWIGAVVMLGLWFIVSLLETAIRRNALDLLAVDFLKVSAVVGLLMFAEAFLAFVLWGSAAAAIMAASSPAASAVALVILIVVGVFWMVLHSYLIAVRFSAIDIMRLHASHAKQGEVR
jgi:hypothetical protein